LHKGPVETMGFLRDAFSNALGNTPLGQAWSRHTSPQDSPSQTPPGSPGGASRHPQNTGNQVSLSRPPPPLASQAGLSGGQTGTMNGRTVIEAPPDLLSCITSSTYTYLTGMVRDQTVQPFVNGLLLEAKVLHPAINDRVRHDDFLEFLEEFSRYVAAEIWPDLPECLQESLIGLLPPYVLAVMTQFCGGMAKFVDNNKEPGHLFSDFWKELYRDLDIYVSDKKRGDALTQILINRNPTDREIRRIWDPFVGALLSKGGIIESSSLRAVPESYREKAFDQLMLYLGKKAHAFFLPLSLWEQKMSERREARGIKHELVAQSVDDFANTLISRREEGHTLLKEHRLADRIERGFVQAGLSKRPELFLHFAKEIKRGVHHFLRFELAVENTFFRRSVTWLNVGLTELIHRAYQQAPWLEKNNSYFALLRRVIGEAEQVALLSKRRDMPQWSDEERRKAYDRLSDAVITFLFPQTTSFDLFIWDQSKDLARLKATLSALIGEILEEVTKPQKRLEWAWGALTEVRRDLEGNDYIAHLPPDESPTDEQRGISEWRVAVREEFRRTFDAVFTRRIESARENALNSLATSFAEPKRAAVASCVVFPLIFFFPYAVIMSYFLMIVYQKYRDQAADAFLDLLADPTLEQPLVQLLENVINSLDKSPRSCEMQPNILEIEQSVRRQVARLVDGSGGGFFLKQTIELGLKGVLGWAIVRGINGREGPRGQEGGGVVKVMDIATQLVGRNARTKKKI